MNATDISANKLQLLQNDWWQQQFSRFTVQNILLVLLFSLISSVIIAIVYKRTYRGVLYNPSFGVTLVLLTMITSSVVMAIGSNVALSMGMVGALSIVRFRTAVKDSIDTAYMFWSITMGILIGTGYYLPALVVVLGISVVMIILSFLKLRVRHNYLLVIDCNETNMFTEINRALMSFKIKSHLRSKTISSNFEQFTYEVKMDGNPSIAEKIKNLNGVVNVTLVSIEGESA